MADIIERLHSKSPYLDGSSAERTMAEAANEIERLQRLLALDEQLRGSLNVELVQLRAALREYACTATDHPCGCYDQFLSEKAEIDRLERHIKDLRELREFDRAKISQLRAEIERLTERGMEAEAWCDQLNTEIERLRAENESLRRALDVVPGKPTEQDIEWATRIITGASRALEDKP